MELAERLRDQVSQFKLQARPAGGKKDPCGPFFRPRTASQACDADSVILKKRMIPKDATLFRIEIKKVFDKAQGST
ncbi:hypothetical protein NLA06_00135 [Desulfomicrobium sp. ZS1]|jgi:hypothetical protein|uniref:hypothetical protein n=1 Tax=Desulfomicrobium sp. ZS1 TaxID=2952228 RepID=UPI0020B217EC|nr:hypothetical protein [Desulfomicrobium sp. ZS1]UTF50327.1 hypothetical protein NLA06_00135 [Desulfomicrobium sp. ZS1]